MKSPTRPSPTGRGAGLVDLRTLILHARITDAGLTHLTRLTHLTKLDLSAGVSDAAISRLRASLPNLVEVRASR